MKMSPSNPRSNTIFYLLLVAAAGVFFGRSYQHLFWDAPFRTLLWDENWMNSIVENFTNLSWETYITSMDMDARIQGLIRGIGLYYFICGLAVFLLRKYMKWVQFVIYIGVCSLILLAALYMKEKFFHIGQFFEYALQFMTPLFLIWYLKKGITPRLILFMKITIAMTFVCHGLYAVNYYPRPGNFVDMTINSFGISESAAVKFLTTVGWLDFLVAIGIFLPRKISRFFLGYAILWGTLTTLARLWAHISLDEFGGLVHQWGFESLFRVCHFLVPMGVLGAIRDPLIR